MIWHQVVHLTVFASGSTCNVQIQTGAPSSLLTMTAAPSPGKPSLRVRHAQLVLCHSYNLAQQALDAMAQLHRSAKDALREVGHVFRHLQTFNLSGQITCRWYRWGNLCLITCRVWNYCPWQAIFLWGRQISPFVCPTGSHILQPHTKPRSRKVGEQQPKSIWKRMLDWLQIVFCTDFWFVILHP